MTPAERHYYRMGMDAACRGLPKVCVLNVPRKYRQVWMRGYRDVEDQA